MPHGAAANAGRSANEYHRNRISGFRTFTKARDETAALTEQIAKIEKEIDERLAALYGL